MIRPISASVLSLKMADRKPALQTGVGVKEISENLGGLMTDKMELYCGKCSLQGF